MHQNLDDAGLEVVVELHREVAYDGQRPIRSLDLKPLAQRCDGGAQPAAHDLVSERADLLTPRHDGNVVRVRRIRSRDDTREVLGAGDRIFLRLPGVEIADRVLGGTQQMSGQPAHGPVTQRAGRAPPGRNLLQLEDGPGVRKRVEEGDADARRGGFHTRKASEPRCYARSVPPTADPAALRRLLDLQAEDSAIKRLQERRAALPEAQRLSEVRDRLAELEADLEIARKQRAELTRELNRIEGEVGIVDAKIQREEARMYSGGVSNPKELGSLQAEVGMLKRKKGTLEDEELEVMVQAEEADATLGKLESEHTEATTEADTLQRTVDELTKDMDAQLETHTAERASIATEIPDDLLKTYEQLRDTKGGIGVAALQGGTCQGCHTSLSNVEVERLRAAGGLQRCDNCRRILVVL